jgi:hypothetical protein
MLQTALATGGWQRLPEGVILIMKAYAILALMAVAGAAHALDVVAANNYATTPYAPATGLNTIIRDTGQARTAQLIINQNQLGGMAAGDIITGVSFRMYNGITGTYTGATWTDYTINVGQAVAPNATTTTFASNFVGTPTTVQSGALTMSGFTQTNTGAVPNPWCNVISFQTPYVYTGGHLGLEFRHAGSTITNPANSFLEAVPTTDTLNGYGTNFTSYTATGNTATTGAAASFTMVRITYTAAPEPASMTALGLGVLALIRRKRSK